ncbi:SUZ domain-containing protein 1-like [Acanthaster planci]|uniref:SUZ domain-containing protein 1-like n=1 Tax=Acanthaster planci TaxID=133434 RepID=A0A8B7YAM0_ACAPL|nr:SUZ domain-containing protein 1-like [Acanthaster planci]
MTSNHDGNLDNLEDDELGSWEEMEDSGVLDERLEKQLKSNQMMADRDRQSQAPIMLQEDSIRTAYQPQLKILRRPTGSDGSEDLGKESKQAVAQTKSLAEREAAYAAARRRIMGSAANSEESRQDVTLAKPSTSSTRLDVESGKRQPAKGKR